MEATKGSKAKRIVSKNGLCTVVLGLTTFGIPLATNVGFEYIKEIVDLGYLHPILYTAVTTPLTVASGIYTIRFHNRTRPLNQEGGESNLVQLEDHFEKRPETPIGYSPNNPISENDPDIPTFLRRKPGPDDNNGP